MNYIRLVLIMMRERAFSNPFRMITIKNDGAGVERRKYFIFNVL